MISFITHQSVFCFLTRLLPNRDMDEEHLSQDFVQYLENQQLISS